MQHYNTRNSPGDVLVVDDDPLFVELMVELLTEEGYTVRCAENGLAGWQAIESAPPAVLLLDMTMPIMDGAELALRLRMAHYTFPIVMITTGGRLPEPLAPLDLLYIAKPFELQVLLNAIAHAVGPQGAHVSAT